MNILVLCDNQRLFPDVVDIFRKVGRSCVTSSDDINPKLDYQYIIKTFGLVFSVHCKKIFPKILTSAVRCINSHPGYNPYNRGMYPHVWSIINGLPAGVTIHEMTEDIDNGPIIIQKQVFIRESDTGETLYERIIKTEIELLAEWIDKIVRHEYFTRSLTSKGNYNSKKDFKALCNVAQRLTEYDFNLLRALSHSEYNNARYNNHLLKLLIYENPISAND